MNARPVLAVENLRTEFVTASGVVRVVDDVSFELNQGETLGLVGESGSGKSVTALSVVQLVPPPGRIVAGSVWLHGRDLTRMSPEERRQVRGRDISIVFQDPMSSLNPVMTIGNQVMEAIRVHRRISASEAHVSAIALLDSVGIPDPRSRFGAYPHQFSGGMRQRVMIAMAIAVGPSVILADEITTALDATVQAQILELLKHRVTDAGTAVLLISHNLGVVAGMADRVHVMYAGRIVEKASTVELFSNPRMPYTWGLFRSLPRINARQRTRLASIEGSPPDLSDPPPGCRFQARCAYRRPVCAEAEPPLAPVPGNPNHEARCWGALDTEKGGWLIGHNWRTDRPDASSVLSS